jgi:hypothetical protein
VTAKCFKLRIKSYKHSLYLRQVFSQPADCKFELDCRVDLSPAYRKIIESTAHRSWFEIYRSAGLCHARMTILTSKNYRSEWSVALRHFPKSCNAVATPLGNSCPTVARPSRYRGPHISSLCRCICAEFFLELPLRGRSGR